MDKPLDLGAALKPDLVTLIAPDAVSSISVSGMEFAIPEDGVVKAPEHIAKELESHGFKRDLPPVEPPVVRKRTTARVPVDS